MKEGLAGKIAKNFIDSKLTILLMILFMAIGIYGSFLIPREEEPQIEVPMADLFLSYPGASPKEVESRVVKPLEKLISNIPGVEYVYATAMEEQAMVIIQFYVGQDVERSLVKLYTALNKNMGQMPPGVSMPLIKARAIDDVPMLGITLWSSHYNDFELKQQAEELGGELKKIKDVAQIDIIGGRSRELSVVLNKNNLANYRLKLLDVANMIRANNSQQTNGRFIQSDTEFYISTGNFLRSKEEVANLVVGSFEQRPVYLHQIATVHDGPEIPNNYVSFGYGKASEQKTKAPAEYPAITLAIAKRKGADAMQIAARIEQRITALRKHLIPDDVNVSITRNYGETASQKVSELLLHLIGAIIAVTLVVMLAMGWRGGLVVFLSVPVTFALTLLSYYMLDYTLNRITLFALVFVTGIVVDDSIIIAENMHRHFKMKLLPFKEAALYAINEVGNPTILATFTVIASVLPMAFVSGLMGPYMSPMPIGASIAMLLSLFVALTITPYLGYLFLREKDKRQGPPVSETEALQGTRIYKLYERLEKPLIESPKKRWLFLGGTLVLLLGSMFLFFTNAVVVKMLPFDNKNEFQVIIDMPEGTTLERTAVVAKEISQYIAAQPEVINYQSYVGTAAPITFNGLVRHYDLRQDHFMADIQVNLTDKHERSIQSHAIVKKYRPGIQKIARKFNANVKLVEVPPGPPVLATIVGEVYGPNYEVQQRLADSIQQLLTRTPDVVDIDVMTAANQIKYVANIDKTKAMQYGISPMEITQTLNTALNNRPISHLYNEHSVQPIGIVFRMAAQEKSQLYDILQLGIPSATGTVIPIGDLVTIQKTTRAKSIYRKNQKRVVYVTADMAGVLESPVYAILGMTDRLKALKLPHEKPIAELYTSQPDDEQVYTVKWDGEWQITLEVFRDLGLAFGGVIIIIYMLIVGWFQNFKAPIVMMVAIPLSMVGIIVGHWLLGAFFTATSFIGMIALAGIMVRNSVLLIDFVNLRLDEDIPLKQAVIEAGAVRTTPIVLTAGTVVIGAFVILFDPIFQGLAISLMGGTITATVLTLLVVPLVYYLIERKNHPTHEN